RGGDAIPRAAGARGERRLAAHSRAKRLLGRSLLREERGVREQLEEAPLALQVVLEPPQRAARLARLFPAAPGVAFQRGHAQLLKSDADRALEVALVGVLPHGAAAVRAAGVAHDEHEVALLRSRLAPGEVVLRAHRRAVLVDAEEGKVQVVAREREVVGI